MTGRGGTILVTAALGLVAWLGACSDTPCVSCPPPPPPSGFIASDPIPSLSSTTSSSAGVGRSVSAGENAVYVSLLPGTVAGGSRATVHVVGRVNTVITSVFEGGFDPVPITANVGDSIEVVLTDAGGAVVQRLALAVAARRPPMIVRTEPPPKKRDHPLNATIVLVFSEPVAGATVTGASVQLFRGSTRIPGTVHLLQGYTAAAAFEPSQTLEANADYRLVVTQGVRDFEGDALAAGVTVEFTTGTDTVGPAKAVTVLPDSAAVAIGSGVQLTPTARDTAGIVIVGRALAWSSDNPTVASVSAAGLVTALAEGVAHVRAELDGRVGVATILVAGSLAPVDSVELSPDSATVVIGGLIQLTAVLRDAAGNVVRFRSVTWRSSNPSVASVSEAAGGTAVVLGLAAGAATITATSEGKRGTATIAMGNVGPYTQISAGGVNTCALATTGEAWCWGGGPGHTGALGNGTGLFTSVPAAVTGGLRFSQVNVALESSCGLTPGGDAFCWGYNGSGEVGTGDTTYGYMAPVAVAGSRHYVAIDGAIGWYDNCALSTLGAAYCWGWSEFGALGLGTATTLSRVPEAVLGGLTFTALAVGVYHTCALTTTGAAYCWGRGDYGAIGDSTAFDRFAPVPVAGGLAFVALTAGGAGTCGLTSDGTAYCWGLNDGGELGIGTTIGPQNPCPSPYFNRGASNCSTVPVPVSGGLHFASISAGDGHTCALTSSGAAYCWGANTYGQLGDGSSTASSTPVAVAGGLTFASISAGGTHTCGLTAAGVAYCWGGNWGSQLGDGSTADSRVPVKVAGQP